jgi:hypothetical protein
MKGESNMHKKYITQKVLLAISVIALAAMIWLNATYDPWPEPDVVCPMANQHIEWTYARCD